VKLMPTVAGVDPLAAAPSEQPGLVHQTALERASGRVFAVVAVFLVLQFWFSSLTVSGLRPGSVAAGVLLSLLLVWQAGRAFRRPPSQRDLNLLVTATVGLILAIRILAVPGRPFLDQAAYVLAVPAAVAWAVWSRRLIVPIPVLLVVLATGAWDSGSDLAVEQSVAALATVTLGGVAVRFVRVAARRADEDADRMARELARRDAAGAIEETERRAANIVHDDVLSVLWAVAADGLPLPAEVLAAKARLALSALARQVPAGSRGFGSLAPVLQRQALRFAPELNVGCDIDGDLDVPGPAVEALSAAVGEVVRNVAKHAGVRDATVSARDAGSGGVEVIVRDRGIGFDPAQVGSASMGLRNSVIRRLEDVGGSAEVISAPGEGTTVVLTWKPPQPVAADVVDPLAWARRVAPPAPRIFLGFMLPILLSSLVLLGLRWHDQRWQLAAAVVFLCQLGLAELTAQYLSEVRMPARAAAGLAAANTALAAAGALAVAPGTTDAFSYWVAGGSGIVVAAIYFVRGPASGLTALAFDLAALLAGLLVTGRAIATGAWLGILGSPVIGTGLAVGLLAAFRSLSNRTEFQLADYRERLRRQERAQAISRADSAALENARRVAGPVLAVVASGKSPDADLRMAAALADATLRDELLAPGFLTTALAKRARSARTAGASITVDFARQEDATLVETARQLLAAALDNLRTGDDVRLHVHPPTAGEAALLILHVRSRQSHHLALRRCAQECSTQVTDLGGHELLIQLQPGLKGPERALALPRSGYADDLD
jgi:signal transduction histidine kinase